MTTTAKTKIAAPLEWQEHQALVRWLNMHAKIKDCYCMLDNGKKRTKIQGAFVNRLGLRRGASDLFIYCPTKSFHGLWLEVKRNKKYTPSERNTDTWIAQEKFMETVKSLGYAGEVCYGFQDGINIVERYLLT